MYRVQNIEELTYDDCVLTLAKLFDGSSHHQRAQSLSRPRAREWCAAVAVESQEYTWKNLAPVGRAYASSAPFS